tara:strand:- start:1051 stop:1347 length:297 start_codon:yes stop_codon:yes gene_type:complete
MQTTMAYILLQSNATAGMPATAMSQRFILTNVNCARSTKMKKIVDKTWSIKHEGHLNKNNIIFNEKMNRLIQDLERVNNSLGHFVLREGKWIKEQKKQ